MNSVLRRFQLVPLLLLLAACAGSPEPGDTEPSAQTRLVAENRSSFDMDIYSIKPGQPATRLGLAPAGESTNFSLPPTLLAGGAVTRFEARPIRGGDSVLSEPFSIRRGDDVTWSIPPQ